MKPLVTWLKVKRAAVTELTLIEKVQNKVKLKKKKQQEEPQQSVTPQFVFYQIFVLVV